MWELVFWCSTWVSSLVVHQGNADIYKFILEEVICSDIITFLLSNFNSSTSSNKPLTQSNTNLWVLFLAAVSNLSNKEFLMTCRATRFSQIRLIPALL